MIRAVGVARYLALLVVTLSGGMTSTVLLARLDPISVAQAVGVILATAIAATVVYTTAQRVR